MLIFGALVGLAVFYFAVQAALIWILVGAAALGTIGYLIGRWMDAGALKKK
ncbi:MAG TPA: hypothetical protein VEB63_07165 [Chitinophagaceae bacterium]|nr:hypothetical protein [Chitinophagaceae bacterium]